MESDTVPNHEMLPIVNQSADDTNTKMDLKLQNRRIEQRKENREEWKTVKIK